MLNKSFTGTVAFVFAFVSLMILVGNFAYAQKEAKGPEIPEALGFPICPTCENVVPAKRPKGKITAPVVMNCPDCKKEISEFGVYHCDMCEKEFLVCMKCLAVTKAATKCPKCKNVLARQIKGKITPHVKWKMKCPDCKAKPEEWLIQHCDKCEADFLACPICAKKE
jgi:hypothetical protein